MRLTQMSRALIVFSAAALATSCSKRMALDLSAENTDGQTGRFNGTLEMSAARQGGELDATFGTSGHVQRNFRFGHYTPQFAVRDAKDNLLVGGLSQKTNDRYFIARFSKNGAPDPTFGRNGFLEFGAPKSGSTLLSIAPKGEGEGLVLGTTCTSETNGVCSAYTFFSAKFNDKGELDPTYGEAGQHNVSEKGAHYSVTSTRSGIFVISRVITTKAGVPQLAVDRLLPFETKSLRILTVDMLADAGPYSVTSQMDVAGKDDKLLLSVCGNKGATYLLNRYSGDFATGSLDPKVEAFLGTGFMNVDNVIDQCIDQILPLPEGLLVAGSGGIGGPADLVYRFVALTKASGELIWKEIRDQQPTHYMSLTSGSGEVMELTSLRDPELIRMSLQTGQPVGKKVAFHLGASKSSLLALLPGFDSSWLGVGSACFSKSDKDCGIALFDADANFSLTTEPVKRHVPVLPNSFSAFSLQNDGSIWSAGTIRGKSSKVSAIAAFTPEGRIKADFGPENKGETFFEDLSEPVAILPIDDGKALVMGTIAAESGEQGVWVRRLLSSGKIDIAFDTKGHKVLFIKGKDFTLATAKMGTDGRLYLAGQACPLAGDNNMSCYFSVMAFSLKPTDPKPLTTKIYDETVYAGKIKQVVQDFPHAMVFSKDGTGFIVGSRCTKSPEAAAPAADPAAQTAPSQAMQDVLSRFSGAITPSASTGKTVLNTSLLNNKTNLAGVIGLPASAPRGSAPTSNPLRANFAIVTPTIIPTRTTPASTPRPAAVTNSQILDAAIGTKTLVNHFTPDLISQLGDLTQNTKVALSQGAFFSGDLLGMNFEANSVLFNSIGNLFDEMAKFHCDWQIQAFKADTLTKTARLTQSLADSTDAVLPTQKYAAQTFVLLDETDTPSFMVAGDLCLDGFGCDPVLMKFHYEKKNDVASITPDLSIGVKGRILLQFRDHTVLEQLENSSRTKVQSMVLQRDGKIVIGCNSLDGDTNDIAIARIRPDSLDLDPRFGPDGTGMIMPRLGSEANFLKSIVVQENGGILLAGEAEQDFALLRLTP